jgi:hypothetical protein
MSFSLHAITTKEVVTIPLRCLLTMDVGMDTIHLVRN